MKTLIIYFSQTGNTRAIAERIRDGIIGVTGQCDLVEIDSVNTGTLGDYDLVGLGCPVFYYQEPFNVRSFIETLPTLTGKHWFIFCSHGSVIGNTFPLMMKRLHEKGIVVIGHHDSYADGTVPFYPYPTLTTGHPDSIDLEQAHEFGKTIAARRPRIAEGDTSLIPGVPEMPPAWIQNAEMLSPEFLAQMMPKLTLDMDACIHCHICEDNCPVKGIDVESDPPRIQDPCIYCFYCAKSCPTLAIDADWDMLVSMAPQNYEHYRHALDEAAARGEFRWLVDPDSMNFDDPLHKQHRREIEREKNK